MKSVNNKVRNVLTVVLVIALMVLSKYSFADTTDVRPVSSTPVAVKYVGSVYGQDVIQVEIENILDESIEISFVDLEGVVLYSETFTGKKITKKFLLDMPDVNYENLQLVVTSKKKAQSQSFKIAKNTSIAENMLLAKLK